MLIMNKMEIKEIQSSHRVTQVQEYYFSRKLKEVAQLNAAGKDIISLGIGGPDRPPHSTVVDTLCREASRSDTHGYQSYVGIPELRRAYSEWYRRWYGVTLDPEKEILPLIGSKEGILHITLAFVNPGDAVLVPNPGYPTYTSVSRLAEAEVVQYNLTGENGWYPNFDELERLPLERVKLMWVNYPNMPTGAPATMELYEKLVDFGKRHGIVIVNDNPYSFILNDRPISMLSVAGAKDIAIEMNSLSKSHNMAGWRMGMLASNARFVEWVLKVKSNIDSGQFRPAMEAAVAALSCDAEWYHTLNDEYARRRKVAEAIMRALGCTFDASQRGLFLWGRIPENATSSEKFADQILYEARVFITPGFIFGSNGERYVRISLCATEEKLKEALARIQTMKKLNL